MLASQPLVQNTKPHMLSRRRGARSGRGGERGEEDARMEDLSEGSTRVDRKGRKVNYQKGLGKRGRVNLNSNSDGDVTMRADRPHSAVVGRQRRMAKNMPGTLNIKGAAKVSQEQQFSVIDVWRKCLASRYNALTGMLNLENLAQDPILIEKKIEPPTVKGSKKLMASALWKLVAEECPNIRVLSLASNQLQNLGCLQPHSLVHYLGDKLTALSLAQNQIGSIRSLNPISQTMRPNSELVQEGPKGLEVLKELLVMGNPFTQLPPNPEGVDWRTEVQRRFPSLESLDQQPLPSTSSIMSVINAPVAAVTNATGNSVAFPLPMQGGYMDAEAMSLVTPFLTRFLPLFDNGRKELMSVYAPHANFSYSVDTSKTPVGVKRIHAKGVTKGQISWDDFRQSSRNMTRVGYHKSKISLATTKDDIDKAFSKFPKTFHDLSKPETFVVDGWRVDTESGPTIMLIVHGEFTKPPTNFKTSFDRTFVLAPAENGSVAQMAGWPCQILSDQLNLRGWVACEAWALNTLPIQTVLSVQPVSAPTQVAAPPTSVLSQPQDQQAILARFMQDTRLLSDIAQQCLTANGWDYERAMTDLKNLQNAGQIPASAYQS